jgi:N utilization substance protein A
MEIRGIGEKTIDQIAEGGYYTIMQVFEESNVVKLGEVTGIGIKKARQIKQAISQYLEEQARAAILPDVERPEETEETAQAEAAPAVLESVEEEVAEENKDSGTEPT